MDICLWHPTVTRLTQERVAGIRESSWRAIEKKERSGKGEAESSWRGRGGNRVSTKEGPREIKASQFLLILVYKPLCHGSTMNLNRNYSPFYIKINSIIYDCILTKVVYTIMDLKNNFLSRWNMRTFASLYINKIDDLFLVSLCSTAWSFWSNGRPKLCMSVDWSRPVQTLFHVVRIIQ